MLPHLYHYTAGVRSTLSSQFEIHQASTLRTTSVNRPIWATSELILRPLPHKHHRAVRGGVIAMLRGKGDELWDRLMHVHGSWSAEDVSLFYVAE